MRRHKVADAKRTRRIRIAKAKRDIVFERGVVKTRAVREAYKLSRYYASLNYQPPQGEAGPRRRELKAENARARRELGRENARQERERRAELHAVKMGGR